MPHGAVLWSALMHVPIRLYLTRHGRTHWNQQGRFQGSVDIPLDEVGRTQAAEIVEKLRGKVQVAVSSDLSRARETARIIADALNIPLLDPEPELRERGYGILEGLTREEILEKYPDIWVAREGDRNFEVPGAEPCADVIARVQGALVRLVDKVRGRYDRALVVGHGGALRMFVELLSQTSEASFPNLHVREVLHDGTGFRLDPREF